MFRLRNLLLFLCILILSSFNVFSTCNYIPANISITSGNHDLGNFNASSTKPYINPNFASNPIKIKFIFKNTQECFNNSNQMKLDFFSRGILVNPTTYIPDHTNVQFKDEFEFDLSGAYTLRNNFISNYYVYNTNSVSQSGYPKTINFNLDSTAPSLSITNEPIPNHYYNQGENISIGYTVSDSGSKLDSLSINDGASHINLFNRDESYSGYFNTTLDSSKTISFIVRDKLGFTTSKTLNYNVDDSLPTLNELSQTYFYTSNTRYVKFTLKVSDNSFDLLNNLNPSLISANFSQLSSTQINIHPFSCNKSRFENNSFYCYFDPIEIPFRESKQINIKISIDDNHNNINSKTFSKNIVVDYDGPTISKFELRNALGTKNIFSAHDNSSQVYLEFSDASLSEENLGLSSITIQKKFDRIIIPGTIDNCNKTGNNVICKWNLAEKVTTFNEYSYGNATFEIRIIDKYGNPSNASFNARFDNVKPVVKSAKFDETTDIKDDLIQTDEVVNFKMIINDKNLDYDGNYHIYANFSNFNLNDKYQKLVNLTCAKEDNNNYSCVYNGIKARSGYVNTSVDIYVLDSARNIIKYTLNNVEIFNNVSNGKKNVFIQNKSFKTLNPINRNAMVEAPQTSWFSGELQLSDSQTYKIVNYQLANGGCNEMDLDPIHFAGKDAVKLYPFDIIKSTGNYEKDRKYTLKVNLADFNDYSGLNDKNVSCSISVSYRDNKTIYPPEIVNFTLGFRFYDLPRGTILRSNAEKILGLTKEVEFMQGWHGTMYSTYKSLDDTCTVISEVGGILSTIDNIWLYIQIILNNIPITKGIAEGGSTIFTGTDGILSGIGFGTDSVVVKMCDFVTCKNGGLLTDLIGKDTFEDILKKANLNGAISNAVCSIGSSIYDKVTSSDSSGSSSN